eukprot:10308512-Prorocentrum_lima.AAC.1
MPTFSRSQSVSASAHCGLVCSWLCNHAARACSHAAIVLCAGSGQGAWMSQRIAAATCIASSLSSAAGGGSVSPAR